VKPVTNWSWLGVLAGIQPAFFWVAGGMLHLQAETREYLYPSAQWVFFGGLTVGGALAALGWRSRNSPAVFQGAAQLVVGTGAALSLSAIDELLARNVAFGLYFVAALFTAAAWWTIRYVPHPPAGRRATGTSDAAPADGIVEGDEADRDSAAPTPAADEEQSRAWHRVGSDRVKRTSSYLLVSIDVLGLLLFVLGTVILWDAHPQRTDSSPVLLGMLMMVPATLALILFGWIAEVRLCWMLGLATVVPMLLLVLAETTRGARPLALAAIAGVGVAAFAVETLRRLRRNSVPHRGVRGEPPEPAPVSAPARQP
jgi:hypothetical protein